MPVALFDLIIRSTALVGIRLERRRAGKTGASGARTSSGRTSRCRDAPPGGIARWGQWLAYLVMRFTFGLGRTKPTASDGQADTIVVSANQPWRLSTFPSVSPVLALPSVGKRHWPCPSWRLRRAEGAWRTRFPRIVPGTADDHRHRSPVRGFRFADNTRGP